MKTLRRVWETLERQSLCWRWIILGLAVCLLLWLLLGGLPRLVAEPVRYASQTVWMDAHGIPDVELKIVYPLRISDLQTARDPAYITLYARARTDAAVQPLQLVLPLSEEALAYVGPDGSHVAGRMEVVPGYPDALPYDLRVVYGQTQARGSLLQPYWVEITPAIRAGDTVQALPELAFRIRIENPGERATRQVLTGIALFGTPALLLSMVIALGAWIWVRLERDRRLEREKRLATTYGQLRESIKLERWVEARERIEQIRLLQPRYRDVDQLDTEVSSAETATWRRDQLYRIGVEAYKARDWPAAVQALATIEAETPFYRDVRFLRRTAALYVDLVSRDRSRRLAAAHELGEIADLVDMTPLLHALADRSEEVAQAAEEAFRRIGTDAFDTLLAGLALSDSSAQARAQRLLAGYGQTVREPLLAALHSSNPAITSRVAVLLSTLGARENLALALLWLAPEHLEGVVQALIGEGVAASGVLIEALLKAPPERRQTVLNAIGALKSQVDITRRIEDALRNTKDARQRVLLQRALDTPATSFRILPESAEDSRFSSEAALPAGEGEERRGANGLIVRRR